MALTRVREVDVRPYVEEWRRAGVIDESAAAAIRHYEEVRVAPAPAAPTRRLSLIGELLSYLGIVLIVASGTFLVARIWHTLGTAGQGSVGLAIAAIGFVGAYAFSTMGESGTERLGWLFALAGTAGAAMATGIWVHAGSHSDGWTLSASGAVAALISAAIWRNEDRPVQFLATLAGLGVTVSGVVRLLGWEPSSFSIGVVVWLLALALVVLAHVVVRPSLVAFVTGTVGLVAGATAMADLHPAVGIAVGLASASGIVAAGVVEALPIVTLVGVIGFFEFTMRFVSQYLHGVGAVLGAFVVGAALIGAVLWRSSHPHGPSRRRWPGHSGHLS